MRVFFIAIMVISIEVVVILTMFGCQVDIGDPTKLVCLDICSDNEVCMEGKCSPPCEVDADCIPGCCLMSAEDGLRCVDPDICAANK